MAFRAIMLLCLAGAAFRLAGQPVFEADTAVLFSQSPGDHLSVSFCDYDRNGFADIFLPSHTPAADHRLYSNAYGQSFSLLSAEPLEARGAATVGLWGDYDNDGFEDLLLVYAGAGARLFHNEGGAGFDEVIVPALRNYSGNSFNGAWVDVNNDSYLDIFLSDFSATRENVIFLSNGDGSFRQLDRSTTLRGAAKSLGAQWCDYDGDGDADLFVPNDGFNALYRNEGGGRFEEVAAAAGLRDGGNSVGASWGDYDNDGDFDLFVANTNGQANFLYNNQGDGTFQRIVQGYVAEDAYDTQGSAWGDVNNDGWLDLYITNGSGDLPQLYLNNGNGTFRRESSDPATQSLGFALGAAQGDIDNDGDLDLYVPTLGGQGWLFRNRTRGRNWLEIKLRGERSNRDGIGAKITIQATVFGQTLRQSRYVATQSGGGPGAQGQLVAHFGLGNTTSVDYVLIEWPSGYRQLETNLPVSQLVVIEEAIGSPLSGTVFFDRDGNCVQDPGEEGIPNLQVRIEPGGLVLLTDSLGRYASRLLEGDYTVSLAPQRNWRVKCPEDSSYRLTVGPVQGQLLFLSPREAYLTECGYGCTRQLAPGNGQRIIIGANEQVCIPPGVSVSGSVQFAGPGSLIVCGEMNLSGASFGESGGIIVVSSGGSFRSEKLDLYESAACLINYGQETQIDTLLSEGAVANLGKLTFLQLSIGERGSLLNLGQMDLLDSAAVHGAWENRGPVQIAGKMGVADSGSLINYCTLISGQGFTTLGSVYQSQFAFLEEGGAYLGGAANCNPDSIALRVATLASFLDTTCANPAGPCSDTLAIQVFSGYHFALESICPEPDLQVSIATDVLNRGFPNDFAIRAANRGTDTAFNVQLEVLLSRFLDMKRASVAWTDTAPLGNHVRYRASLGDLPPFSALNITFTDSVTLDAPIGRFLETTATLRSSSADCDSSDNSAVSVDEVVGSYDPNDKLVFPPGIGAERYILASDTLYYKIRFQNVGSFMATNVVILDTLSPHLDVASFRAGPMSHIGSVELLPGNVVRWTFLKINLPDSASNESLSKGFVQFKILPRQDLGATVRIENRAGIYFDFNEPIITNTVFHTITDRLSYEEDYLLIFAAYPNPITDEGELTVYNLRDGVLPVPLDRVDIQDVQGRSLGSIEARGQASVRIRAADYPAGAYFARATDIYGFVYTGHFVIIR